MSTNVIVTQNYLFDAYFYFLYKKCFNFYRVFNGVRKIIRLKMLSKLIIEIKTKFL